MTRLAGTRLLPPPRRLRQILRSAVCTLVVASLSPAAIAADVALSGFGTLGYAVSNVPFRYQRFIDDRGTFMRDSVFAVQADASLSHRVSATLQMKLAPQVADDTRWGAKLAWGFLSWRPTDDWLLRGGRLRMPIYLDAENMDVGVSYDFARLPIEMYSLAPTMDLDGVNVVRTWDVGSGEVDLDAYWGKAHTQWRYFVRADVPGYLQRGPQFVDLDLMVEGLALTYRGQNATVWRLGLHRASTKAANGNNWVDGPGLISPPAAQGASFWWMAPGGGLAESRTMDILLATLAADVDLGGGLRGAAEYAMRRQGDAKRGLSSSGGYASLRKQLGNWTPYVYYAELRSDYGQRALFGRIYNYTVPSSTPNAATIDASQKAFADTLLVYDQSTWAIGTSYALGPAAKLKAEWLRTRIGTTSALVDAPAGGDVRNRDIDVLSLSYSFMF